MGLKFLSLLPEMDALQPSDKMSSCPQSPRLETEVQRGYVTYLASCGQAVEESEPDWLHRLSWVESCLWRVARPGGWQGTEDTEHPSPPSEEVVLLARHP